MRRIHFSAVILVLTFGYGSFASRPHAAHEADDKPILSDETVADDQKIMDEIKDHSELMSNLEYLSDMIGQRLTGSENLKKANDWTKERFAAYGVDNPHLESWQIAHTWTRGIARGRILTPAEHPLSMASYAWAPGTNGVLR